MRTKLSGFNRYFSTRNGLTRAKIKSVLSPYSFLGELAEANWIHLTTKLLNVHKKILFFSKTLPANDFLHKEFIHTLYFIS